MKGRAKYISCKVSGGNSGDVISTKEGGQAVALVVAILEIKRALREFNIILHMQDGDTLDALGDQI